MRGSFTLRDMAFLAGTQSAGLIYSPRTTEAGNQRTTEASNIRTTEASAGGDAFEPETDTLLAAFSGTYDSTRKANIDALIAGLKADGDWNKILALYIVGANAADTWINWKTPGTFNVTNFGLTVTPFTKFQGNGSSQYADTGIIPSSHLSLNSMGLMVGQLNNSTIAKIAIGCSDASFANGTWFSTRTATNNIFLRLNQSASSTINSVTDSSGIWIASRFGSTSAGTFLRRNGVAVPIATGQASTGLSSVSLKLCVRDVAGSLQEYSSDEFWMMGVLSTGPDATAADRIRSRLATYQATL